MANRTHPDDLRLIEQNARRADPPQPEASAPEGEEPTGMEGYAVESLLFDTLGHPRAHRERAMEEMYRRWLRASPDRETEGEETMDHLHEAIYHLHSRLDTGDPPTWDDVHEAVEEIRAAQRLLRPLTQPSPDSPREPAYAATDREGNRWTHRQANLAAEAHGCVLVPEVSFKRMKERAGSPREGERDRGREVAIAGLIGKRLVPHIRNSHEREKLADWIAEEVEALVGRLSAPREQHPIGYIEEDELPIRGRATLHETPDASRRAVYGD